MTENRLVGVLRAVTRTVKLFPFMYSAFALAVLPVEAVLPIEIAEIIGLLAFTSAPTTWLCWRLSRLVSLCHWHRAQCLVMTLPIMLPICRALHPIVDTSAVRIVVAVLLVVSLINCYMVFVRPSAKVVR